MKSRLKILWSKTRDSLWFLPTILTLLLSFAGLVLLYLERTGRMTLAPDSVLLPVGGVGGARALLSAVATGLITVTGVVFSVTVVALQLSSSQFTPRVLPNYIADRANQVVLGILIGTFSYSLLVLRVIEEDGEYGRRFVPRIAVAGGMLLAIVSIAALIFFINHAARSIQVSVILESTTRRALDQVERLFPEDFGEDAREEAALPALSGSSEEVTAAKTGYLQVVDSTAVFAAQMPGIRGVVMERRVGDFILEGEPIARVFAGSPIDEATRQKIRTAFILGSERTRDQDYELTLIQISDIAVKALSPGVNDPTTAEHCLDRLSELILALGRRYHPCRTRSEDGRLTFIARELPFALAVESAFGSILHFAAGQPKVLARLRVRLETLERLVPPSRRAPLRQMRERIGAAAH
jgi:uncharacterized membrane protein